MTVFLCTCILASCFILTIYGDGGELQRFKSNEELSAFRAVKDPHAIFYYHFDETSDAKFMSRTEGILQSAVYTFDDVTNTEFMRLGMINCIGKGIVTQDIPECVVQGKRVFYAYKDDIQEKFSLRGLYDLQSFVAHMMYFVYQDDIGIVERMEDWEYYQSEQRGWNDILFMYFKALGSLDHYNFMEFFHNNKENYRFIFTNNESFAEGMGITDSLPNVIWFAKCSTIPEESTLPCPIEHFSDTETTNKAIHTFIKLQTMPLVSEMTNTSGWSIFSDVPQLHILYLFVDNDGDKQTYTEMLENVIKTLGKNNRIQLRGVIADRWIGEEIKTRFGIMTAILPTAFLCLHGAQHSNDDIVLEPYTPDEDLVEDSLYKFVFNLVNLKDDYYNSIDQANYIECVKAADWKESPGTPRKTLIGVCSNAPKHMKVCSRFKEMYRRVVRTMYTQVLLDYNYIYVDNSNKMKLTGITSMPAISFILPGKKMVVFEENLSQVDYGQIIQWVNKQMKLELPVLPPSGSDFLPLPPALKSVENHSKDPESDDDDNEELQKYQDDEVAKAASLVRNTEFYYDDTSKLTDETFEAAVNDTELLIVYFFTPTVDDISFLIQPVIAAIAKRIEKDPTGSTIMTKITKVNCEDEFLTCTKHVNKFPTIRFYSKGKYLGDYKGLLEEKSLMESIRLYQQPTLGTLTEDTILKYIEPTNSHISVLGWFESENQDFKVFEKVAEERRGKMLFAYATGEAARKLIPEFTESSFVVAYIQNMISGVFNGTAEDFTKSSLDAFLSKASIPPFGELTVSNFPTYKSFNQPMLVLFTPSATRMDSTPWISISEISKDNSLRELVLLTWMNTDHSITKEIRRSYLGGRKERHDIVIVNHKKAEVYHYSGPLDNTDVAIKEISMWIRSSSGDDAKATSYLNTLKWQPRHEGFDFLHLIDNNIRRASMNTDYSESDKTSEDDQIILNDGRKETKSFQRLKRGEGSEKNEEVPEEVPDRSEVSDEDEDNEDSFIYSNESNEGSFTSSNLNRKEEL